MFRLIFLKSRLKLLCLNNFEFFLSPGMKREVEYQFVFAPLKQTFFGTKRHLPIPQPFDEYWKVKGFKLECTYGKDFFTAEFFVPYSAMHKKTPQVYDTWHCNVVRNKLSMPREYSGASMPWAIITILIYMVSLNLRVKVNKNHF